jgi:sigma-B regulation protein RsbU (phosphoserine phosphatase)
MDDITNKQLELNSLIEFSQLINTNLNLEFILGNILLSIMGKMMITKGAVLIKCDIPDCDDKTFAIKALKGINLSHIGSKISFDIPKEPIFEIESVNDIQFFKENKLKFFFKIYFIDKLLGVLCFGDKLTKQEIKKSELLFIETMLNLSAPTIENSIRFEEIKILNKNMSAQIQHLRTLFELSKEFNSNFQDRSRIIKLLKYSLLGNFGIKDYVLLTKTKAENFKVIETGKTFDFDTDVMNQFDGISEAEIIDENTDNVLKRHLFETGFRLIIPVKSNNVVETIVLLGEKLNKSAFTIGDIQFLESLINLSVISLDNTVLFNEYLAKQKIESELDVAREIQVALLPKELPEAKGYSAVGCNIPALHVGGDYYDMIKLTDDKFAIVIADVSGKGTPASLLMSNIQSAVHSFFKFYDDNFNLEAATQKINELIFSNTSSEKFITFFWGILDVQTDEFTYVNAGHNPPFLFKGNDVINLDKGGLMLGVIEGGIGYTSGKVMLDDKDVLVLYTDGVSEARNTIKDEYSEERIIRVVNKCRKDCSESIQNCLLEDIKVFTKGENQYDDITMIVLKKG